MKMKHPIRRPGFRGGDDLRRLIAALKSDERWRSRLDWSRLALASHSLGGYTVLALAGAWGRAGGSMASVRCWRCRPTLSRSSRSAHLAGFFAWTDIGRVARGAIVDYGVAFLDHYVNGAPAAGILTGSAVGVAEFRYTSELGSRR